MALSTEQGFSAWLALGTMLRGWALAEQGHGAAGISEIREGLTTYRTVEQGNWWWTALSWMRSA